MNGSTNAVKASAWHNTGRSPGVTRRQHGGWSLQTVRSWQRCMSAWAAATGQRGQSTRCSHAAPTFMLNCVGET